MCEKKRRVKLYGMASTGGLVDIGMTGTFVKYGINYVALESGTGIFTSAIVERDDGTVINVSVEWIRFIKDDDK